MLTNVKSPTCAKTAVHAKTVMAVSSVFAQVDISTIVLQILVQVRTMSALMSISPPYFNAAQLHHLLQLLFQLSLPIEMSGNAYCIVPSSSNGQQFKKFHKRGSGAWVVGLTDTTTCRLLLNHTRCGVKEQTLHSQNISV